jgi:hypothetical protein
VFNALPLAEVAELFDGALPVRVLVSKQGESQLRQFAGGDIDPEFVVVVAHHSFDVLADVLTVEAQRAVPADFETDRPEFGALVTV